MVKWSSKELFLKEKKIEGTIDTISFSNPPLVSLIVLCYNDVEYVNFLLHNLEEVTHYPNYEIYLINNASKDHLASWLEENLGTYKMQCHVLNLPVNLGFGKGMNVGITQAHGKYLILMNTDIILQDYWLTTMVAVAEKEQDAGIIGLSTIPSRLRKPNKKITSYPSIVYQYTFLLSFPVVLIRKENCSPQTIGTFDPYFFMYYEDIDLLYRSYLQEKKVFQIINIYTYHGRHLEQNEAKKRIESAFSREFWAYTYTKSRYYFVLKWESLPSIFFNFAFLGMQIIINHLQNKAKAKGQTRALVELGKDLYQIIATREKLKRKTKNYHQKMKEMRYLNRQLKRQKKQLILSKYKYLHYTKTEKKGKKE